MIVLRPATEADARLLFAWVNEPDSLSASLKTRGPIPWDRHLAWLKERLHDPHSLLCIAEEQGRPIGQIRLQDAGEGPEVSLYVAVGFRGRGAARDMLRQALARASRRWPDRPVTARVKPSNHMSARLFEHAGFRLVEQHHDQLLWRYDWALQR